MKTIRIRSCRECPFRRTDRVGRYCTAPRGSAVYPVPLGVDIEEAVLSNTRPATCPLNTEPITVEADRG